MVTAAEKKVKLLEARFDTLKVEIKHLDTLKIEKYQTKMEFQAGSNPNFLNINVQAAHKHATSLPPTVFGRPSFTMPHSPPLSPAFGQLGFAQPSTTAPLFDHPAMPQRQQRLPSAPQAGLSSSASSLAPISTTSITEYPPADADKLPKFAIGMLPVRPFNKVVRKYTSAATLHNYFS